MSQFCVVPDIETKSALQVNAHFSNVAFSSLMTSYQHAPVTSDVCKYVGYDFLLQ